MNGLPGINRGFLRPIVNRFMAFEFLPRAATQTNSLAGNYAFRFGGGDFCLFDGLVAPCVAMA